MNRYALILLFLALLFIEPRLNQERYASRLESRTKITPTEILLRFLGEIRYTLASYLWLKTEIYHHELNLTAVSSRVGKANPKKVGEILALCRLVTRLDPGFVQAYDLGAWRLAEGLGNFKESFDFLKEGLDNNPKSTLLNSDMGNFYFFYLKDCNGATPYLEKATEYSQDKLEKVTHLRILGRCFEKENQNSNALIVYRKILELLPNDPPTQFRLKHLLSKPPQ